jgi:hypothetical protein
MAGAAQASATLEVRLRCHPTGPGLDVEDISGNSGTLLDEPLRGCLSLLTKISWIDRRRMIWMQEAFCSFDPIIGNTEYVFVLRSLVMNAHLLRPQHHQRKFSGCILHVSHPSFCASMSPREVKATLIPPSLSLVVRDPKQTSAFR